MKEKEKKNSICISWQLCEQNFENFEPIQKKNAPVANYENLLKSKVSPRVVGGRGRVG